MSPDFWQGLFALNLTQASNPPPRVPPVFPTQAKETPRLGCLHPYPELCPGFSEPTPICPLQGALTDRELLWGKVGRNGVIVREVRPVDSVLTMRLQLLFLLQNQSVSSKGNYGEFRTPSRTGTLGYPWAFCQSGPRIAPLPFPGSPNSRLTPLSFLSNMFLHSLTLFSLFLLLSILLSLPLISLLLLLFLLLLLLTPRDMAFVLHHQVLHPRNPSRRVIGAPQEAYPT